MRHKAAPAPRQGGKAQLFGAWGSKEIISLDDFIALEEAVYASDDDALRYYMYLNTKFQQDVGLTRTPGVTRLLQRFGGLISGDAMRAQYLMIRAAKPPKARRGRTSSQAVSTAPILPAEDAEMVEVPSAEASSDSQARRPGPEASFLELIDFWARVRICDWPLGMCNSQEEIPDRSNRDLFDRPHAADVQASWLLYETQPIHQHQDDATRIACRHYAHLFIHIFSIRGLYRHIL